ncbi:hypothetical protein SAMN02982922_4306 [Mesorhizobium australicum]|uniref:Uncharacterized protein n=1 Tax=Mesorhizobium australicum TaxID=536018 RepID=A0A1X7PJV7_9HYPH|nr:hypothetical protein SAMN02982922_4306 [Mesorhizobium australicum]
MSFGPPFPDIVTIRRRDPVHTAQTLMTHGKRRFPIVADRYR